jgi:transposase InsO family protein
MDDILVWGRTLEEHDARVRNVMQRLREAGVTLGADKCVIGLSEVPFLGDIVGKEGIRPDPERLKGVSTMPTPESGSDVNRFLGFVNYHGKYVPHLSTRNVNLRSLTRRESDFIWGPEHAAEWNDLKQALVSAPVLGMYNPDLPVKVSGDASKFGLGAVLLQQEAGEWKPIAYASRVLTQTESRYSQIEKEALASVYACEKFHQYIYGQPVIVETDHKPLIAISKKPLCDVTPRVQRMFFRLLRYNVTFVYVPGKHLLGADMLSRATKSKEKVALTEADIMIHAVGVVEHSSVGPRFRERLVAESKNDPILSMVMQCLASGIKASELVGTGFDSCFDELTDVNGVLMKNSRVVIPRSMREEVLTKIHEGHLGINRCTSRARRGVFWPGMNAEIEQMVRTCSACLRYRDRQQAEPIVLRDKPQQAWQRVGVDIFELENVHYLAVIDAYSNFPELVKLRSTTADAVISELKQVFARHGIPLEVLSDGGPQFECAQFRAFAADFDFAHTVSSPRFPQSNRLAESGVKILKNRMRKATAAGQDVELALLAYRSTPLSNGKSPAEWLFGRQIRSRIPTVISRAEGLAPRQRSVDNSRKKPLSELQPGDVVSMRDFTDKTWAHKCTVLKKVAPRSYMVRTEDGTQYRRNRRHLLRTGEGKPSDVAHDFYMTPGAAATSVHSAPRSRAESVTGAYDNDLSDSASGDSTLSCRSLQNGAAVEDLPTVRRNPPRLSRVPSRFKDFVLYGT